MNDACDGCRNGKRLDFDFTMAFQPIIDIRQERVWGYEALVRGTQNESAWSILSQVSDENKYRFDQSCRIKAVEMASTLFPDDRTRLSINFLPNAVYEPSACLRATLGAAAKYDFNPASIMFEFTENEDLHDPAHLQKIITEYRKHGFITAIDDFGAGYSGLSLLADFQPDLIKLDMKLIRDVDSCHARQTIVSAMIFAARELNIAILAEGIETEREFETLRAGGVHLFQGYYFAKPAFEALPPIGDDALASVRGIAA